MSCYGSEAYFLEAPDLASWPESGATSCLRDPKDEQEPVGARVLLRKTQACLRA